MTVRSNPRVWHRLERLGVFMIALHSFLIGLLLLFATRSVLDFAGWTEVSHLFFPRQSGAFHIILAIGYFWEYHRLHTIRLILLAKGTAVVFLLVMSPWKEAWSVPFSAVLDGLMLAGMVWVHGRARRNIDA